NFFMHSTSTTQLYTLSLHDALPIFENDWSTRSGGASPGQPLLSAFQAELQCQLIRIAWMGVLANQSILPNHRCDHREIQARDQRSEEHTSELQSRFDLVCRLLLEKK